MNCKQLKEKLAEGIESIDEFKEITTEDIENTWYVKLLRSMGEKNDNSEKRSQI